MAKNNVRAITAESPQTFDEAFANLESTIAADVPITDEDKKGARASEMEMSKLDFIINNFDKVDDNLPKKFDTNIFTDSQAILKEKKRQLAKVQRLVGQIENQIAVVRIRLRPQIRTFYLSAEKAYKDDSTLKYIVVNLKECYARTKSNSDDADTPSDTPTDAPK